MTKIETILIGINFTEDSRQAFYMGLDLASKYDAQTYILHVAEPIKAYDFGKRRYVETKETIERVQEGVTRRVNELWEQGGVDAVDRRRVQVIVRGGRADDEIVASAVAKNVDLIVLGGTGGLCERIVRHAPCSVICVAPQTD
jgi:nucleotide-binding universal stress UspA family protein